MQLVACSITLDEEVSTSGNVLPVQCWHQEGRLPGWHARPVLLTGQGLCLTSAFPQLHAPHLGCH
jgi:hypothetical protein